MKLAAATSRRCGGHRRARAGHRPALAPGVRAALGRHRCCRCAWLAQPLVDRAAAARPGQRAGDRPGRGRAADHMPAGGPAPEHARASARPPGRCRRGHLGRSAALAGQAPWAPARCNLFLTLGRHRWLFRGWLSVRRPAHAGRAAAPPRERAGASCAWPTCATAATSSSTTSSWGAAPGSTAEDVERVTAGPEAPGLGRHARPRCWAPSTSCTPTATSATPPGRRCASHLDEREAIELCMLAGHYEMPFPKPGCASVARAAGRSRARWRSGWASSRRCRTVARRRIGARALRGGGAGRDGYGHALSERKVVRARR